MTASSPEPRRIATPGWLDLRLVLGVVLVLASVVTGAVLVSRAGKTRGVVAATRDLAAGTVLRSEDLTTIQVQLPGNGSGVYLASVSDALGRQLGLSLSKGELVPSAAVEHVEVRTTLTVPLESGAAPDLRTGERIEVWVSTSTCSSVVLLPDVAVQAVHVDSGGSFTTGSGGQDVVISVDRALADRVVAALALDQAQLRAGVLVGTPQPSVPAALPGLGRCAKPTGTP